DRGRPRVERSAEQRTQAQDRASDPVGENEEQADGDQRIGGGEPERGGPQYRDREDDGAAEERRLLASLERRQTSGAQPALDRPRTAQRERQHEERAAEGYACGKRHAHPERRGDHPADRE